jgi:hypothetical protein
MALCRRLQTLATVKEEVVLNGVFAEFDEIQEYSRVFFDKTSAVFTGILPEDMLNYLRQNALGIWQQRECFYLIEKLPIPIMTIAMQIWQESSDQNNNWSADGF